MALFKRRHNVRAETPLPVKRGRGRPRKIEQPQQGSEPNTQIVQSRSFRMPKINLFVNKKRLYWGLAILIAIIPTIYFYAQNKNTENKLSNLQQKSQTSDDLNVVIGQIGKLVILPTGEQPTLATVSDITKLKGQTFFTNAANGDRILVYPKAKKVILYRPSLNKIVEMAPLGSSDQPSP